MSSFIQECLSGNALMDEIDDHIEKWHSMDSAVVQLYEFLGMTRPEYNLWVSDPSVLPFIIKARKENRPVSQVLEEFDSLPMAARSQEPESATKLLRWLKSQGLWD
jgi:hypothetical protein